MTAHNHTEFVEDCYRCQLSRDQMASIQAENTKVCEDVVRRLLLNENALSKKIIGDQGFEYVLNGTTQLHSDEYKILCSLQDEELEKQDEELEEEVLKDPKVPGILEEVERLLGVRSEQLTSAMTELKRGLGLAVKVVQDLREEYGTKPEPDVPAVCLMCGHGWDTHDQLLKGAGKMVKPEYNPNGYEDLYQCNVYAGMGNWCGCEERSRQPLPVVSADD